MTPLSLLSISHVLLWEVSILDMAYMWTLPIKFEKLSDVGILARQSTQLVTEKESLTMLKVEVKLKRWQLSLGAAIKELLI